MNDKFDELARGLAQSVTRRAALKQFGVGLAGIALATMGLCPAEAITLGVLDGEAHPNVGVVVYLKTPWAPEQAPLACCSGTLVHPRVFLTAGHCTFNTQGGIRDGLLTTEDLRISFGTNALDTRTWRAVSQVITHPDYAAKEKTEAGYGAIPLADVGVVILKEPVVGLTPAQVAPQGFLESLQAANVLRKGPNGARFTVVGYGIELGDPPGQLPFPPDGARRVALSEFMHYNDRWLFLDQNGAHYNGGAANCDSGGPAFWVDSLTGVPTLVALTSRGDARNRAIAIDYRVDTAEALAFINQIIAKVEAGEL